MNTSFTSEMNHSDGHTSVQTHAVLFRGLLPILMLLLMTMRTVIVGVNAQEPTTEPMKKNASMCPCFQYDILTRITEENINDEMSCKPTTDDTTMTISLWKKNPSSYQLHHGFGFVIRQGKSIPGQNTRSTCLFQGDMMMEISTEEAIACAQLIRRRCYELGRMEP